PMVDGGRIYVSSWEGGGARPGVVVPEFAEVLALMDADGDGKVSEAEHAALEPKKRFDIMDLGADGFLDERDWEFQQIKGSSSSALLAIEPGDGRGDLTETPALLWRLE